MPNYSDNTIMQGSDLMLFVNDHAIAFATNHTVNITSSGSGSSDVSNKDTGAGGWASTAVTQLEYTISTENLYSISAYDSLFDIMTAKQPIAVKFGLKLASQATAEGNAPERGWTVDTTVTYYTGTVVMTSLNLTATNGESAQFTAEFASVGALVKVDSNSLNPNP